MSINYIRASFLAFFLPVFFLKLINITASNHLLIVVSLICALIALVSYTNREIDYKTLTSLTMAAAYTGLLVLTCGKQGAFFSVISIIMLYKVRNMNRIYRAMLIVGIIGVIVSCYIERNGNVGTRFNGKDWVHVYKRSNILFISFTAVVVSYLYLICKRQRKIKIHQLAILCIIGYAMYKYSGSRTGALCYFFLVFMLVLSRYKRVFKNVIFKYLCIFSPVIGLLISFFTAYFYGRFSIINKLDSLMQGRIAQSKAFLLRDGISFFGQRIFESNAADNFWNLDCAYMDMLICYGLVFTVLWLVITCKTIRYLYDQKRYIEVSTIVMYAVYGISETFLPNCFLNPSILLYAEYIYSKLYSPSLKRMYLLPLQSIETENKRVQSFFSI